MSNKYDFRAVLTVECSRFGHEPYNPITKSYNHIITVDTVVYTRRRYKAVIALCNCMQWNDESANECDRRNER